MEDQNQNNNQEQDLEQIYKLESAPKMGRLRSATCIKACRT